MTDILAKELHELVSGCAPYGEVQEWLLNAELDLLEQGRDLSSVLNWPNAEDSNRTVLMLAAVLDQSDVIRLFCQHGADCMALDGYWRSAFFAACAEGYQYVVEELAINCYHNKIGNRAVIGLNIEERSISGNTPLLAAVRHGHLHVVQYLVTDCGANVRDIIFLRKTQYIF
ncbi:ankyrin repeat domain-containing protein [archaeon]|nr:MAG: ankyrin repeat domain-containing protein [archaeon]